MDLGRQQKPLWTSSTEQRRRRAIELLAEALVNYERQRNHEGHVASTSKGARRKRKR